MACNKWEETGLLYCSSELSEQDVKLYEAHLGECPECKDEFTQYKTERSLYFTSAILEECPSEKVDNEIKRVCAAKKQYTGIGFFPGFLKKSIFSVSFFILGFAVVGYFIFNIQNANNQNVAVKQSKPAVEVKTLAQKDSAASLKDSLKDSAVYFSKNRGNLQVNGVFPVDLK